MKGKKIHMVGIGGIGMSALAQLYQHEGARVTGSDRSEQPTTEMFEKKCMSSLTTYVAHYILFMLAYL